MEGNVSLRVPTYDDYVTLYPYRFKEKIVYWADASDPGLSLDDFSTGRLIRQKSDSFLERIIYVGDKPVGTITARDIDHRKHCCTFGIVIVKPDYWGKGYGSVATKLFLADLSYRGIQYVYLETFRNNRRVQAVFKKFGFVARRTFFSPESGRFVVQMKAVLQPFKPIGYVVKPETAEEK